MSDKVPNVYKHALVDARPAADARAAEIRSALSPEVLDLVKYAEKQGVDLSVNTY